jgi:hypothetical protein
VSAAPQKWATARLLEGKVPLRGSSPCHLALTLSGNERLATQGRRRKLWEEACKPFGVLPMACGAVTGVQTAGWFNRNQQC